MIFTLEVDGKPILVFEARSESDARAFIELDEFRDDLGLITTNGVAVCLAGSQLIARQASSDEINTYHRASSAHSQDDGPTFVFLVQVDGLIVHVVDPGQ